MLSVKQRKQIDGRMLAGRDLAKGTMNLYVSFATDEEVEHAQKWLKGKKKVKNIEVGLHKPSSFPLPTE